MPEGDDGKIADVRGMLRKGRGYFGLASLARFAVAFWTYKFSDLRALVTFRSVQIVRTIWKPESCDASARDAAIPHEIRRHLRNIARRRELRWR